MVYIISRKTRREREESLAESRSRSRVPGIEGVARRTEEAYEIERARAKEGKPFDRPYAVSGDSPEARQAETDLLLKAGIDPDSYRPANG